VPLERRLDGIPTLERGNKNENQGAHAGHGEREEIAGHSVATPQVNSKFG